MIIVLYGVVMEIKWVNVHIASGTVLGTQWVVDASCDYFWFGSSPK